MSVGRGVSLVASSRYALEVAIEHCATERRIAEHLVIPRRLTGSGGPSAPSQSWPVISGSRPSLGRGLRLIVIRLPGGRKRSSDQPGHRCLVCRSPMANASMIVRLLGPPGIASDCNLMDGLPARHGEFESRDRTPSESSPQVLQIE